TFSLVQALKGLIRGKGDRLRKNNQKIACITYTNAAAEVISNRIGKTSLVEISTIHVFCWSLMGRFQQELKKYVAHHPEFKNKVSKPEELANGVLNTALGGGFLKTRLYLYTMTMSLVCFHNYFQTQSFKLYY